MKPNFALLQRLSLAVFLTLLCQWAIAQRTITGLVTDANTGEPLIGANVLIVGTSSGTITDFDGTYSLTLTADARELTFSYTGYQSQTIAIGSSNVLDVVLAAGEYLEEVVVVGYGTVTKKDKTGAVNAVTSDEFNKGAIVSVDNLIAGKVAGVQVVSNSGEPGAQNSIRIRGGTSINAGNEPLYVIDGVPIDNSAHNPGGFSSGRNPLNALNPSDIEEFTVLKDASATAIYGSRGANGVIIITTKKGKAGDAGKISYDGWLSLAQPIAVPDLLSTEEFIAAAKANALASKLKLIDTSGNVSTDWYDQVIQNAMGQSHNLSFTGGAGGLGYRFSLGYLDQDGIVKTSNTQRTSFSFNLNHKLLNDNLKVDVNVKAAQTKDRFDPGVIGNALAFAPTQPIYDEGNEWGGYWEWDDDLGVKNPVAKLDLVQDYGQSVRSIGNIQFDYSLPWIEGLSAKLNLGYDLSKGDRKSFQPSFLRQQYANNGEIRVENYSRSSGILETYLNYLKEFGTSRLDFTAGYSYQDFISEFPAFRAWDLNSNLLGFNNPAPANEFSTTNSVLQNRLISFFGRANYSLLDRYLFTVTVRRDGSSRFGPENRWGTFPSAAIGWRILEEGFMEGAKGIFSDLKLRVGYGITGNQEIGDYRYLRTYTFGDAFAQYQFGNEFITTLRPNGVDPNLKWEETASYNIGLDYGFLNGRINGSIEYYYKKTDDLLFEVTVPAGSNLTNVILTNIGSVQNTGLEFLINATAVSGPSFTWDLGFNAAFNRNEILQLDQFDDPSFIGYPTGGIAGAVGNNIQILRVGFPVQSFFVYEQLYDEDGNPHIDGIDYNEDGLKNLLDRYVDQNDDGLINNFDKRPFNKPAPDLILGLTSTMYIGNLDLSFTVRGAVGNYVYNNVASTTGNYNRLNELTPNNMTASVLESNFKAPQYFSDYYIEDGSFARLDNLTLGYTINASKKFNLRLYATGQNLLLLTKYTGLDPEIGNISNSNSSPRFGIDDNIYPRARAFLFGVNINL